MTLTIAKLRSAIGAGLVATAAIPAFSGPAMAQEAVVAAKDVDALFKDRDPALHRNKQAAYHIMKDLLEAGHWNKSGLYLTDRYLQHNPNVPSGRQSVVDFFKSIGMKPRPIPAKLSAPVVQVIAQRDYVVVVTVATLPLPGNAKGTYTTSWFDMWRFVGGKADEHWDSATMMPPPPSDGK